MHLTASILLVM